jgi:hypothetical protein
MDITGKITGIKYKISLTETLKIVDIKDFNINESPPFCLVKDNNNSFAVSKWVSPKRTRSYPYERVYNTLNSSKKITIIPIIKDEGAKGDRDFLQWDTVSLMSLLDVFVIFAYYEKAEINACFENKVTNQQFNNEYVISKIKEIERYHSSALHWNLNELSDNLVPLIDKVKDCYAKISKQTGVKMHDLVRIDTFKAKIQISSTMFMLFSREKAKKAQAREMVTTQPKESLSTLTKARMTITNYLGGEYYFTVDEILIENDIVYLIESKHSKASVLPSKSDIKDGLLKMILYSNLCEVEVNGVKMKNKAVLKLTSPKMKGKITQKSFGSERAEFIFANNLKGDKQLLISELFREAEENGFEVQIGNTK